MTTFPIALACCTDFSTFLLLVAPADGLRGTLTLVHEHWPIDEAMLPSGSTNAEILAEVRDMLADYQGRGVVPDHLVYVGEGELEQEVQRFAAAEGVVKIAVVKIAVRLLEPRLKHERVWSAPLVACFVPTGKIVVNFAP